MAEDLRPLLAAEGLAPLAKTSGGKGLQLYAPISGVTSEQASDQARAFAERLERDQPRRVVSRMTKVLRTGKVLIDWSQNNGSKTTVAPYSLRARPFPTVSTPVSWDEVRPAASPRTCSSPPARCWTGWPTTAICSRRCSRRGPLAEQQQGVGGDGGVVGDEPLADHLLERGPGHPLPGACPALRALAPAGPAPVRWPGRSARPGC